MDLGITDRVALVAASSRGLGRAVAEDLAEAGARLVLCARSPGPLESARAELAESGAQVVAVSADLTEPPDLQRVITAAETAFGQVDILVTNTGGPPPGRFEEHSAEIWRQAVRQNLDSVINLTRAVLPGMKERGWGRIINITSIAVKQPVDGLILSNAVRAAVTGFAKTLANEVAAFGVTVNNVLPGYTRTERVEKLADNAAAAGATTSRAVIEAWERQIPMGRLGEPREFAAMVAFLASERAAYITGTSTAVDGGWVRGLL